MNFINLDYIKNIFPNVKYAFRSEYIFKTSRIKLLNKNEKPTIDTILVCDDIDDWHKDNYKRNKSHYPLIARYTSVKLVTYFQRKGAKIHFNTFADHDQNLQRYGVVSMKDFEDDLKHWKTLTVSSYMHKPYTIIVDSEQFVPFEKKNLLSALCVSALLHLNEGNSPIIVNEKDFYDKIIKIPFIKGSYFKLFDDKMIEFDVEELIDEFRELYLPSMEDIPNKYIKFLRNESEEFGKFVIENSKEAKMFLIDNLPKEVIREMSLIGSAPNAIEDKLADSIKMDEKTKQKMLTRSNLKNKEMIQDALNKILKKHRSTRIFLILMGKWVFIIYITIKLLIKALILYYFYKKSGKLHLPFFSSEKDESDLVKH